MNGVVLVADLLTGETLFEGFRLCRGAVLVCAADVQGVVVAQTGEAREDVCREDTADYVAQVGYVVDVG